MIRGYCSIETGKRRPFIDAVLQFPTIDHRSIEVPLLVAPVQTERSSLRMTLSG